MVLFEFFKNLWAWEFYHITFHVITLNYGTFQNSNINFGEDLFLAFWINSSGGVPSPIWHLNLNSTWFLSWMQCEILAHYLTEGSDNSPPLNRISSRDLEVCRRKEGYSTRRRSSLSHVASFLSGVGIRSRKQKKFGTMKTKPKNRSRKMQMRRSI